MLKDLTANHKNDLLTNVSSEVRQYVNFRNFEYPDISNGYGFIASESGEQGSFHSYLNVHKYIVPTSQTFTMQVYLKPQFAYDTGSMLNGVTLRGGNGESFNILDYSGTDRRFKVNNTNVFGTTYTSNLQLQVWTKLTIAVNGSSVNAYHGTNKTSFTLTQPTINYIILEISSNSTFINNVRFFPDYFCTDADVSNDFRDFTNREVYFSYNKTTYGFERINVTKKCNSFSINKNGIEKAKSASITLLNKNGEFSDDQFDLPLVPSGSLYPSTTLYPSAATYNPSSEYYNGDNNERYLQRKIGIELETYYNGTFEPLFRGWTSPGQFSHSVTVGGIPVITLSADDGMADIARKVIRKTRIYVDKYIVDQTNEGDSIFHLISKLALNREVYNYIGNSWQDATTSSTSYIFGTDAFLVSANGEAYQYATMQNLSLYELFSFSCYVKGTAGNTVRIKLEEVTDTTINDGKTETIILNGGWQKITVSHTIANSNSNKLLCKVNSGTSQIYFDGAMLVYGLEKNNFVENTSGTSGESTWENATLHSYLFTGIDTDDSTSLHPWAVIKEGDSVFDALKEINDAMGCRMFSIDSTNVLRFRSAFITNLGSTLGTVTKCQSINNGMQEEIFNKLKISGVLIKTEAFFSNVWSFVSSGEDNEASGNTYKYTMSSGEYFPDFNKSPEGYDARYDDSINIKAYGRTRK